MGGEKLKVEGSRQRAEGRGRGWRATAGGAVNAWRMDRPKNAGQSSLGLVIRSSLACALRRERATFEERRRGQRSEVRGQISSFRSPLSGFVSSLALRR